MGMDVASLGTNQKRQNSGSGEGGLLWLLFLTLAIYEAQHIQGGPRPQKQGTLGATEGLVFQQVGWG